MVAVIAAIISGISFIATTLIGRASFHLAKRQLAAMNTQAEASKAQAEAAKVQADASRIQAEAATEALKQAARWREEEERRAEPQFHVTATRINRVEKRDGRIVPPGERPLASVAVVVENKSSRDATINHVGIEDVWSENTQIFGAHDLGIEFPHRLASGHQIEFMMPGKKFFAFLGDSADGLPEESEFVVFVAKSAAFSDGSAAERWDSRRFTVRLPSPPWRDQ